MFNFLLCLASYLDRTVNETIASFHILQQRRGHDRIILYRCIPAQCDPRRFLLAFAKELRPANQRVKQPSKRFVFLIMSMERAWYKVQWDGAALYEIILPHWPMRLYFDFDGCRPTAAFIDRVTQAVRCSSSSSFEALPRIILNACGENKLSYHVIFPTVSFANLQHLKRFLDFFLPATEFQYDTSVYSQFRQFRVLGASKCGEQRPLRIDPTTDLYVRHSVSIETMFCLSLISNIYVRPAQTISIGPWTWLLSNGRPGSIFIFFIGATPDPIFTNVWIRRLFRPSKKGALTRVNIRSLLFDFK